MQNVAGHSCCTVPLAKSLVSGDSSEPHQFCCQAFFQDESQPMLKCDFIIFTIFRSSVYCDDINKSVTVTCDYISPQHDKMYLWICASSQPKTQISFKTWPNNRLSWDVTIRLSCPEVHLFLAKPFLNPGVNGYWMWLIFIVDIYMHLYLFWHFHYMSMVSPKLLLFNVTLIDIVHSPHFRIYSNSTKIL